MVNWCERIHAASQLVRECVERNWGISDVGRTDLWRHTDDDEVPFMFIGYHAFFPDPYFNFLDRRRFVFLPTSLHVNQHWKGAMAQSVYLLVCTLATLKENKADYALHDYTLNSTVYWEESDFKPLFEDLAKESEESDPFDYYKNVRYQLNRFLQPQHQDVLSEELGAFRI